MRLIFFPPPSHKDLVCFGKWKTEMALLTCSVAWTLLQQHPPARRNSPLLARERFETWQLVGSEGTCGSARRGMLWMAGSWEGWISQAAVGQGLAVAEQPGDAGGGERCWLSWWYGTPVPGSVPRRDCMHQVHAGVELQLGRREKQKTSLT